MAPEQGGAELPDFQREQLQLTAWLREPDTRPMPAHMPPVRLQIYRELLFNNVAGFIENGFPVLREHLPVDLWNKLVQQFFATHHCQTPYFHGIAEEFLRFFQGLDWPELADYPWVAELVHFEWVELAADIAEAEPVPPGVDPDGDLLQGRPFVSSLVWPLVYHWPVHKFRDNLPASKPADPVCLLVYRDAEHDVGMLEITPLTAVLLEQLQANQDSSGETVLRSIAAQAGFADMEAFLAGGLTSLNELRAIGVILGGLPL